MGCFYSLTLVDAYGRVTTRRYEAVEQTLKADQVTDLENFLTQYAAVTDLGVIRADIVLTELATPFAFTAGANVDVGATFTGNVYGVEGKKASLKLPGIKASLVNADGTITLTQADIEDWIELWVEATPHTLMLSDGETISSWIRGSLDK